LQDGLGKADLLEVFLWSEDTGDANGESVQYSEGVIDGVASNYPQPHMVLSHSTVDTSTYPPLHLGRRIEQVADGGTADSQVVSYAVNKIQGAGYQLVAVDTCLGSNGAYRSTNSDGVRC
jgi:hypothetical protein